MSLIRIFWEDERCETVMMAFVSVIIALQMLVAMALILSMVPITPAPFVKKLFPVYWSEVRPEREMLLYRCSVFLAIAIQGLGLWVHLRQKRWLVWRQPLWRWFCANLGMLGIELFCVFKMVVDPSALWPRMALGLALVSSCGINIFWKEVNGIINNQVLFKVYLDFYHRFQVFLEGGIVFLVVMLVWVTDLPGVLGLTLVTDRFYHLDSFVMMPGWAYLQGLSLNGDITSEYSTVIPAVFAAIAGHVMGGFTYAHVVTLFIVLTLVYLVLFFLLLRWWLRSFPLAMLGLLVAIQWQMFHLGVAPIIWRFPSATVVRFWWDVLVLAALLKHSQTQRLSFLFWACVGTGIALTWSVDAGAYLYFALIVYVLAGLFCQKAPGQGWGLSLRMLMVPVVVALMVLYAVNGEHILNITFWKNASEFAGLFVQGWGALPMTDGLKEKYFFPFWMGVLLPAFYGWTLMFSGGKLFLRKQVPQNLFLAALCTYGLGLYHYYVHRSAVTSFDVVCLPAIMAGCWWLRELSRCMAARWWAFFVSLLLVAAGLGLVTNRQFSYYPNYLNPRPPQLSSYRAFGVAAMDFSKDAAMIDQLTIPTQRVALITSFETAFLMQAKRGPLFYYSPLIDSRLLGTNEFGGTYLHTKARVARWRQDLARSESPYIFVEKKLINGQLPLSYYQNVTALAMIVAYLKQGYRIQQEGQYLVALVRK